MKKIEGVNNNLTENIVKQKSGKDIVWDKYYSTFKVPDVSPLAIAFTDWSLVHSLNVGDEVYYSANDGTGKYRYGSVDKITSVNPDEGYIVVKAITPVDNYYILLQKGLDVIASSAEGLISEMSDRQNKISSAMTFAVESMKRNIDTTRQSS